MAFIAFDSYVLTSLADSINRDSAVALWKLNEPSGTNAADSADSHAGTHEDTGYIALGVAGIPGGDGDTAATYTQHSASPGGGKTSVPDHADWDNGNYTLGAFLKTSDTTNGRRRILQQQAGGLYCFISLENQKLGYGNSYDGGAMIWQVGNDVITDNSWHACMVTRQKSVRAYAYVDGAQQTWQITPSASDMDIGDELQIGNVCDAFYTAWECIRGTLAYVFRVNSPLSPTRIAAISRKGLYYPYVPVVTGDNNYGQAFTPSATGSCGRITLKMHRAAGATGTLYLTVCQGSDFGSPLATSAAVDVAGLPTSRGDVAFGFTPFARTASTQYRFYLSGTSISGSVYLAIDRDGTYAGGDAFHFTSYPTYTTDTGHDVPFVAYAAEGTTIYIAGSVSAGASAVNGALRNRMLRSLVTGGASAGPTVADRLRMLRLYAIPNAAAVLGLGGTWSIHAAATAGAGATCLLEDVASFAGVHAGVSAVCSLDWANLGILENKTEELARQAATMRCARCVRR